jgi:hypothetical protein
MLGRQKSTRYKDTILNLLRNLIRKRLANLPEPGQVDLFAWCRELVSAIMARVVF